MENRFDELSTALARSTTRREALGNMAGFVLGALSLYFAADRGAWGAAGPCATHCRDIGGPTCRKNCQRMFRGRARQRCIAECGGFHRDCLRDCDACRKACGGLNDCFRKCAVSAEGCRAQCANKGFAQGRQRDYCVFICAQCAGGNRGLCTTPGTGGPVAGCCCPQGTEYCPDTVNGSGGFNCCRTDPLNHQTCCPDGQCHSLQQLGEYGPPPYTCFAKPDGSGYFVCGDGYSACYPSAVPNGWVCCPLATEYCCPGGCQGAPCS